MQEKIGNDAKYAISTFLLLDKASTVSHLITCEAAVGEITILVMTLGIVVLPTIVGCLLLHVRLF